LDPLSLADLVWLVPVVLIVGAAVAFGLRILAILKLTFNRPLDAAFGGALGLMALSLATFGLSLARFMPRWAFAALPAAMALAGGGELVRRLRGMGRPHGWTAAMLALLVVGSLGAATLPPTDPDDLFYHLVLPKEIHRAGGYVRLDEWNVCAAFPQNVEMFSLYGMGLTGSITRGVVVGRLLNVAVAVLLGAAIYGAAIRFVSPGIASLAVGMAVLLQGTIGLTALRCATEPCQSLCGWLAGAAAIWIVTGGGNLRTALLGGVMAGLAAGAKYTSIPFCAVPVAAMLLLLRRWREAFVFAGGALLSFAPWAIRQLVENGNPVFPLMVSVFPSEHWTALESARLSYQSSPAKGPWSYVWRTGIEDWVGKEFALNPLLPFLALGAARRHPADRRAAVALVGGVTIAALAVWALATHRFWRFLVPLYPWLAFLAAVGLECWTASLRRVLLLAGGVSVAALAIPIGLFGFAGFAVRLQFDDRRYLEERFLPDMVPIFAASADARPGRILLLGEGRTFWIMRPFIAVHPYHEHPFLQEVAAGRSPEELRRWLRERDVAFVGLNHGESRRLASEGTLPFVGRDVPIADPLPEGLPERLGLTPRWKTATLKEPTVVYEVATTGPAP
jgi:hypothetical protein